MSIATNLRTLRFHNGEMTQEALANKVGVTRQTIIALESGRYAPSLELAMRLADAFGTKVDEVFYWKDGVPPPFKKKGTP